MTHHTIPEACPENASKEDLLKLAARMDNLAEKVYWAFFYAGMGSECHAFLEFCGVLAKYVEICKRCAEEGIDFRMLNTHSGQALPVKAHDMAYLGEKLQCILGPAINANPEAREALRKALFGDEPQ